MDSHKEIVAENIRMLKEIEDQLKKKILGTFSVDHNYCRATGIVFHEDIPGRNTSVLIRYTLNDTEMDIDFALNYDELRLWNKSHNNFSTEVLKMLANKVGMAIADRIVKEVPIIFNH